MSNPEEGSVDLTRNGPVATITINRPQVRNSIDLSAAKRLGDIVTEIENDDTVRVAIFTGAGKIAFSAGADLRARARGEGRAVIAPYGFAGFVRRPRSKPFIAAVNGYAVGGGMEIAMACELVVAAPNALNIRYNLALAQAKAGDKDNARKSLEEVIAKGGTSPKVEEAKALLKTL